MKIHSILLAGASALAISWVSAPALAADAAAAPAPAPDTAAAPASDLTDVIVTARRQKEKLQDVPQTVTPLPATELQALQVRKLGDIQSIVPGLSLSSITSGTYGDIQLRGVNFNNFTNGDQTVAFYLNDADVAFAYVLQAQYDVSQIEVLSGPQGTNRGVSAPSGAITVTTHRPNMTDYGGYVDGSLSDQDGRSIEGAVNLPVIKDVLALRVAGIYQENNTNDVTSLHDSEPPLDQTVSGRISLRFTPVESFEANVMYQYMHTASRTYTQVVGPGDGTSINPPLAANQFRAVSFGAYNQATGYQLVTGNLDYSFLGQKLSYVGEYSYSAGDTSQDDDMADNLPGFQPKTTTTDLGVSEQSQEIRISSQPDAHHLFDYTAGVYYRTNDQFGTSNFAPVPLPGAFGAPNGPQTAAAFNPRYFITGQADVPFNYEELSFFENGTVHLGENTEITGGLREVSSKFSGSSLITTTPAFEAIFLPGFSCASLGHGAVTSIYPGSCDFPAPTTNIPASDSATSHPLLYSVEISHHFTPDFMIYANTGTSFLRPTATIGLEGAFATSSNPLLRNLAFHPGQTSTGYEAGFKWTFPDGRGHLDVSAYHQDFQNFQIVSNGIFYVTSSGSVTQFSFPTSVNASVNGFDVDATYNLTRTWNVSFLSSYAPGEATGPVPCNTPATGSTHLFNTGGIISFCNTGAPISPNPVWNASIQSSYTRPLTDHLNLFLRGLVSYYPQNDRESIIHAYVVPSYSLSNFYAGVSSSDGAWQATLYVKNAFNDQTVTGRSDLALASAYQEIPSLATANNYFAAIVNNPREVGIDFHYAFGSR
jgi:iron complex outermembrane recepter protein